MRLPNFLLPAAVIPTLSYLKKEEEDGTKKSRRMIYHHMVKYGIPGMSVTVTKDGKTIFSKGFGYANVETNTPCTKDSVFRIASISKSITAIIAGKLLDEKKLDLDKNIYDYIKDFPEKTYEGQKVTITSRHLLTHMSGKSDIEKEKNENKSIEEAEFLLNKPFKNVSHALELFKDDELLSKPGEKFNYTTHGFTLLSRVIEGISGKQFPDLVNKLFNELGMNSSYIDNNTLLIKNRVQFYRRNKNHELENCPEVDNSYKIAGGGMLSTSEDLTKFGNALLTSFQDYSDGESGGVISKNTINKIWKPHVKTHEKIVPFFYCLGWSHVPFKRYYHSPDCFYKSGYWYHTGAAVGCSSVLLVKPSNSNSDINNEHPKGICVAILTNVQECYNGITDLALDIAEAFS
uniref:Beta-lactamase domain-containing protein n=1 Tax=Parastrongyloides trichosuri TaxID=131310 RepID=A0A0N4Z4E5_PARTI